MADAPILPVENLRIESLIRQHRRKRSQQTADGKPALRVLTALAKSVVKDHPEEQRALIESTAKPGTGKPSLLDFVQRTAANTYASATENG